MDFKLSAKNVDEQLGALTENAVNEITYICRQIGPRPCGEAGETAAHLSCCVKALNRTFSAIFVV